MNRVFIVVTSLLVGGATIATRASAQDSTQKALVRGSVVDSIANHPVAGAQVQVMVSGVGSHKLPRLHRLDRTLRDP